MEHVKNDCICEGRSCHECNEIKCIESFAKYKYKGMCRLAWQCKKCRSNKNKKHARKYIENNPDKVKETNRTNKQRLHKNPEFMARKNEYEHKRMEDPKAKSHRRKNIERSREKWVKTHRDKIKTYNAKARQIRKKQIKATQNSFTSDEWQNLKEQYAHTCLCCKKSEPEIKLTPDHIVPLSRGGSNEIKNIQPLCLHCNLVKHAKIIDFRHKDA